MSNYIITDKFFYIYNSYQPQILFYSIDQYITAYKLIGEDNPSPILCLLIGVCFLNIVCMKFTTQRATLAVQGVCFLDRYMKVRGHCQEVYYNLGKHKNSLSSEYLDLSSEKYLW